jgi:MFS family permease
MPTNQFSLLRQRRFGPFFWTQFLGAFNDNVFKTALLTILTYDALSWSAADVGLLNNLIPGLFILPFVLFSATAGQFAEKFEKSRVVRYIKVLEVGIMGIAAWGWMTHSLWILVAGIVGMGLHSTLFGPVKYAYLPQQLKPAELIGGNGVIEMGTFVGILLGEVAGAVLVVQRPAGQPAHPAHAGLGAGTGHQLESADRNGAQPALLARQQAGIPGHAGQFMVLVLRRDRAGAISAVR